MKVAGHLIREGDGKKVMHDSYLTAPTFFNGGDKSANERAKAMINNFTQSFLSQFGKETLTHGSISKIGLNDLKRTFGKVDEKLAVKKV